MPDTFNHAFTIAFEVKSENFYAGDVSNDMLRSALLRRIASLDEHEHDSLREACGAPYDTFKEPSQT